MSTMKLLREESLFVIYILITALFYHLSINRLKSERRRVSQYTESKDNSEACSKVMHLCTLECLSHLVLQILGHSLTHLRLVHFP